MEGCKLCGNEEVAGVVVRGEQRVEVCAWCGRMIEIGNLDGLAVAVFMGTMKRGRANGMSLAAGEWPEAYRQVRMMLLGFFPREVRSE